MIGEHRYALTTTWTGNRGDGTTGYRDYERAAEIQVDREAGRVAIRTDAQALVIADALTKAGYTATAMTG